MSNVPTNLIPTRISQLPEAPVADPAGYFPIVISGTTYKVQFSQIQGSVEVPASRQVNAGTGLTGGGSLSADITIAVANGGIGDTQLDTTGVSAGTYGSGANVPVITVNTKGRVTSLSTTPLVISGYVPDSRQVVAGTGLSGGGNLSADRTLAISFSSATPQPLGSASAGTGVNAARDDHVHPAVDLSDATETTGQLPMSRGGTGANLSPIAGAVAYSNGTNFDLTTAGNNGQVLTSSGGGAPTWTTITGVGTVTSVDGSGGTTGLTVSGGPITAAGTLTLGGTLAISAGGTGLAGTPTNGQLLIGNGSGYRLATLTAGTNVTITNATGSITVAAAGDVVGPAGATSGAISLFDGGTGKLLKNSVITINASGVISNVNTPNTGTDAANKQYVDDLASTGLHYHEAVVLSTSPGSSRTDTYNNGTAGVSATLTSVAAGTLVIDGTVATSTIRVLIQDCSNPIGNGVYVVTNPGSTVAQYVMTRSSDANTYIEQSTAGLDAGSYFFTTGGTNNKGAAWVNTNSGVITFGSTAITFSLFSNSQVYTAGNGLSLTATTFSLDTPVTVLNGGTGASTQSGARTALGLGTMAVQDANSVNITGGNVSVGSATITTLTGTSANITTLSGTTLTYTSGTVTNLAVTSLTVSSLSLTNATFTSATITTLKSTSATINNLASTSANITTLTSSSGTVTNLLATTANISSILFVGTSTNTNSSKLVVSGTISETVGTTQYLIASQYDVGTSPNQIPLNQYLGSMAFQSSAAITVTDITMGGSLTGTIAGGTY